MNKKDPKNPGKEIKPVRAFEGKPEKDKAEKAKSSEKAESIVAANQDPKESIEKKADASQNPKAGESKANSADAGKSVKRDSFKVGDRIVVGYKITEGKKSRIQPFEGIVIAEKGAGVSRTFTVRRVSAGSIGVERIFPLHSPNISSVTIKSKGYVRRAKLYYMRQREGRAASRIKER